MWLWFNVLFVEILVQPHFLKSDSFGTHKYITANGIKFHCVTCGSEEKPLMLFLHGFPEVGHYYNNKRYLLFEFRFQFWFSWRYQLMEFSKDYYTVAVDLRSVISTIIVTVWDFPCLLNTLISLGLNFTLSKLSII